MAKEKKTDFVQNADAPNAPASEEKKHRLRELFEHIKEFLLQWRHGALLEKMEEMEQEFDAVLGSAALTNEAVESMREVLQTINGRLDTVTAENLPEFIEELGNVVAKASEQMEKSLDNLVTVNESAIDKLCEIIVDKEKKDNKAEKEKIRNDILANGKIIAKADEPDVLYLLYNGKIVQADLLKKEENGKTKYTIQFEKLETTEKINEIQKSISTTESEFITKYGEKAGYSVVVPDTNTKNNAFYALESEFCKRNNLQFIFDIEKEKQRIMEEHDRRVDELIEANPKLKFIKKYTNLVNEDNTANKTEEGHEAFFDAETSVFYIRHAQSGQMIAISTKNGEMAIDWYKTSESLKDASGKKVQLGKFEQEGDNRITAQFSLYNGSDIATTLLQSSAAKEYMLANGISAEAQTKAFHHNADDKEKWCRVNKKDMSKVRKLSKACVDAVGKMGEDYSNVKVYIEDVSSRGSYNGRKNSRSYTFVQLETPDEKGGTQKMSISFNENGKPMTLNFNNNFSYNINARTIGEDYLKQFGKNGSPEFQKLFNIAMSGLIQTGYVRDNKSFDVGDTIRKQRDAHEALKAMSQNYEKPDNHYLEKNTKGKQAMATAKTAFLLINNPHTAYTFKEIAAEIGCKNDEAKEALNTLKELRVISFNKTNIPMMDETEFIKTIISNGEGADHDSKFGLLMDACINYAHEQYKFDAKDELVHRGVAALATYMTHNTSRISFDEFANHLHFTDAEGSKASALMVWDKLELDGFIDYDGNITATEEQLCLAISEYEKANIAQFVNREADHTNDKYVTMQNTGELTLNRSLSNLCGEIEKQDRYGIPENEQKYFVKFVTEKTGNKLICVNSASVGTSVAILTRQEMNKLTSKIEFELGDRESARKFHEQAKLDSPTDFASNKNIAKTFIKGNASKDAFRCVINAVNSGRKTKTYSEIIAEASQKMRGVNTEAKAEEMFHKLEDVGVFKYVKSDRDDKSLITVAMDYEAEKLIDSENKYNKHNKNTGRNERE